MIVYYFYLFKANSNYIFVLHTTMHYHLQCCYDSSVCWFIDAHVISDILLVSCACSLKTKDFDEKMYATS